MRGTVTVKTHADEINTHIKGGINDYVSLCGLAAEGIDEDDSDDLDMNGGIVIGYDMRGKKVDCEHCRILWSYCKNIRLSHFGKTTTSTEGG